MSEEATTTTPDAAPAAAAPAPAATEGGPKPTSFDLGSWSDSGAARSDLPDNMRQFYDHMVDTQKKSDAFNAVKELRGLIDNADQRAGSNQNRNSVHDKQQDDGSGVEQQVQARLAALKNQESVTAFRGNFESMLKEPIQVGDGHSFAFADKKELETFVNYSRDVLQNGKISPQDLYKLWNFERILADTGEWKARQHEEKLRKTSGGPKSTEADNSAKTSSGESTPAGEQDKDLTVEEIMKLKFPEIYGNMKAGNVRYG